MDNTTDETDTSAAAIAFPPRGYRCHPEQELGTLPGAIVNVPASMGNSTLAEWRAAPERLFTERVRRWCKHADGRRVAEVSLPLADGDLIAFFKCIERPALFKRLLLPLRRSAVRRAFETGRDFLRHRIATPEPLFFVDARAGQGQQYLLTASISDSVTVTEFFDVRWPMIAIEDRQQWLHQGLWRLARQIRRMHDCRYDHRDLKFDNILVSTSLSGQSWFLDLDAVRRWPWLPRERSVQNIARLNVSSLSRPEICRTDRLRFLKHYLGPDLQADWKWWWRKIANRTLKKQNQDRRRGRGAVPSVTDRTTNARWAWWMVALLPLCNLACATTKPSAVGLPARHSVRMDQLLVQSDFKLPAEHPLMHDLVKLRKQVSETLQLPLGSKQVMVYLFSTELEYNQYWTANYPSHPPRRAYFVQTPDRELAVYTHWSDRIQEDLRHEFTHGLLHAGLETVPLWLDEGLAEYFEVAGPAPGGVNPEYAQMLASAVQNGWRPDMERLERLEKVEQMQKTDYREAWAWMHFLLHSSPETKHILVRYLRELQKDSDPRPLSGILKAEMPNAEDRLVSYVATLNGVAGRTQERRR